MGKSGRAEIKGSADFSVEYSCNDDDKYEAVQVPERKMITFGVDLANWRNG